MPDLCPWFPGEKLFSWELPGFWRTFFSLPWHDVTQFPTDSAHNLCGPMTGQSLGLRWGDFARQVSRDVFPSFCLCGTETFSEDRDRNYTIFMLLFRNLQERTLISYPSNLVYCFVILILGNILLVVNSNAPCCDLILTQLSGTQRTHYSATANFISITPAPKKGAQSIFPNSL